MLVINIIIFLSKVKIKSMKYYTMSTNNITINKANISDVYIFLLQNE